MEFAVLLNEARPGLVTAITFYNVMCFEYIMLLKLKFVFP